LVPFDIDLFTGFIHSKSRENIEFSRLKDT